jgi:DNA-directed RNA polymerase specialized sigma24 family protein
MTGVRASVYVEPLEEYLDRRGEWLARCAFVLTNDHETSLHLIEDTVSAAWRFYDWVSVAEDPERYVMRVLLNQFRLLDSTELHEGRRAVGVLRDWAKFSDGRVADVLGCRRATVRRLAVDRA